LESGDSASTFAITTVGSDENVVARDSQMGARDLQSEKGASQWAIMPIGKMRRKKNLRPHQGAVKATRTFLLLPTVSLNF
jgi:hypothetical protein